jgi:hypothetical protein
MTERRILKPKKRVTHGLNRLKRAVSANGMQVLDGRTAVVRELYNWKRELKDSLGGEAGLSLQEKTIIEICSRSALFLNHIDAYLTTQPSLINRRRKTLIPVVEQRERLASSLARNLSLLGLRRRAKPVPSLAEYLASKEDEPEQPENDASVAQDERTDESAGEKP